jgi:hypothetical protein
MTEPEIRSLRTNLAALASLLDEHKEQTKQNFDNSSRRFDVLEQELAANTEATKRIETNTGEVVQAFSDMRGGLRVLESIGRLARPVGFIAAAVAACVGMWTALKTGVGWPGLK